MIRGVPFVGAPMILMLMAAGVRGQAVPIEAIQDPIEGPTFEQAMSGLTHKNQWARIEAVKALGRFPRPEAVEPLTALVARWDSEVSYLAANALGGMGIIAKSAVPVLMKALDQTLNGALRQQAVWALGELGDPQAIPAVTKMLNESHIGLRQSAAHALGRFRHASALPGLTQALRDSNGSVRSSAVEGLAGLGSSSVPAIMAALRDDDRNVSIKAAEMLDQIQDPRIAPALLEVASSAKLRDRWDLARQLGYRTDALPVLTLALKDDRAEVRLTAMRALYYLHDSALLPVIGRGLTDVSFEVRVSAVNALGAMGVEASPWLTRAMEDAHRDVRRRAIEVLGLLGESGLQGVLMGLGDSDKEVRKGAERILSGFRSNICPELMQMARDPRVPVRAGVIRALGQQGCREASGLVLEALKDDAAAVRRQAVWAAGQLGDQRAAPLLKTLLQDPDPAVRTAVAEAMERLGELEDPMFRRRDP